MKAIKLILSSPSVIDRSFSLDFHPNKLSKRLDFLASFMSSFSFKFLLQYSHPF